MSRLNQLSTRRPPENPAVGLHHAQKHKVSRAPMVNPYDKFTQPEFDAWIGDITSALRLALGVEQEEPCSLEKIIVSGAAKDSSPEYRQLDFSNEDEVPDDSFAQIKTRRDKGKARDPREGPGLGKERTQPIEVVSSDEEEEAEVKNLTFSLRDDDSDVYDSDGDVESDYSWERSSPFDHIFPTRFGPPARSRPKTLESNAGSDDSDYDEYEGGDADSVKQANDDSEVITISDDDESIDDEENHSEFDYHGRPGPSSFRYPRDDSPEEDEVQGVNGDIDEIQPHDDDTSFPPHRNSPHRNLELNDPWEAPRKYAEDLYSGGELRLPAGAHIHPDHLNTLDEDIQEDDELCQPYEVDDYETSSNVRSTADIYDSEGIVITPHLDPRFFAHTEDEDSGIDSFLTPGVLTPNQSELRTHLGETEDPIETGFRHERRQPLPHPTLTPSKRYEPIPQDAEIIAVDDSDDENKEDNVVVIPPLDAILEMVAELATRHPDEPEVEEPQPNHPTSFVPLVENIGEDEALSVHSAYTDIELESHLQPFEIVEPETVDSNAAQESLAMFNAEPVPLEELELEEQNNPDVVEIIEPEVMLLNEVEDLDALPISTTVGVDEQTTDYYESFDDIYGTPVPETLPETSGARHLQLGGPVALCGPQTMPHEVDSQDSEVLERSQESSRAAFATGNTVTEVNENVDVRSMRQSPQRLENNGVASYDIIPESTVQESSLEAPRNGVISVDESHSAAPSNDLRNSPQTPEFTTERLPVILSPRASAVPGQPKIPMPVMADASVPDPTESPTRLQEYPILSIPGTPDIVADSLQNPQTAEELVHTSQSLPLASLLHPFNPNADGLFTPADFSTTTTPAEDSSLTMLPEWHEEDVKTVAPTDLHRHAELTDKPAAEAVSSPVGVDDVLIETENDSSRRKSILMADPYPYCLSTPTVTMSEDGSSEDNDEDNSICSSSTAEKENEKAEEQFAFPLAANTKPQINSQPVMTEHEGTSVPLTGVDSQASPQNVLEGMMVEELGILSTLEEKDALVAMELQFPFEPTTKFEDSLTIRADTPVEGYQGGIIATTQQPLEADVDADLQARTKVLEGSILKELHDSFLTFYGLHLPQTYDQVEQDGIPQVAEATSPARPSKRKRETSPDPEGSDSFSVKSMSKLRARTKGKQKGKQAETRVEQPEHDTIHVRPRSPVKLRAADPSTPETSTSAGKTSEPSKAEVSRPPHPQSKFRIPSLFHAHGRTKRQKTRIQPIATVGQTRDYKDQPAPQSETQFTSVPEKPPSQSEPSCHPRESVIPMTTEVVAPEVQKHAQIAALPCAEPFQSDSTTVAPVLAVELPAQEAATTFSPPSAIATVDNASLSTHSIPTTPVVLPPASSPQSSPARLLSASNSTPSKRSTRSQCKYHKITLPKEENGPRVCFLVPGCSLTNQDLIKDEEIEDQGEATYEDSLRIQGIEELDFDQYLIGILRQLVGLDILREGEVFYLPQPGDDVPRKHWPRKSISDRTSTAKGSGSFAGSPGYSYSGSTRSPSTRPPLSNADSLLTSTSHIAATDDDSDMGEPFTMNPGDRISPFKGKGKPRKGKTEDTFQPNEQEDHETSDEEKTKRRKSTKRGVKRTRTLDSATGSDGTRKSKRLKLHLTDSSLYRAS